MLDTTAASASFLSDLVAIVQIEAVSTILRTMAEFTRLRCTFVALVSNERWVAAAEHDGGDFGLVRGEEREAKDTVCRIVR